MNAYKQRQDKKIQEKEKGENKKVCFNVLLVDSHQRYKQH